MDGSIDDPFAPIRMYQDIVAEMCGKIWSRAQKVNLRYRDSSEMSFKSQIEAIEQMKKTEATLRSKRVKKDTYDSDVINSIMANRTISSTLALMRLRIFEFKRCIRW